MNGGSSEVAFHAFRALSLVADLTGERAATIGATAGDGLSLVAFTVGPRFSHRFSRGKFTPFVQGLIGAAHGFDGLFPGSGGSLSGAANARAVLAGGGLDLTIHRHIAIAPSRPTTCVHNYPMAKATNRTCCASARASFSASGRRMHAQPTSNPSRGIVESSLQHKYRLE